MNVFLTSQRKLAQAAGMSYSHLSLVKSGNNAPSDVKAKRLERITGIKSSMWIGAVRHQDRIEKALDRFFTAERQRERKALREYSDFIAKTS